MNRNLMSRYKEIGGVRESKGRCVEGGKTQDMLSDRNGTNLSAVEIPGRTIHRAQVRKVD